MACQVPSARSVMAVPFQALKLPRTLMELMLGAAAGGVNVKA